MGDFVAVLVDVIAHVVVDILHAPKVLLKVMYSRFIQNTDGLYETPTFTR